MNREQRRANGERGLDGAVDLSRRIMAKLYRCPQGHEYMHAAGGWKVMLKLSEEETRISNQIACPFCYIAGLAAMYPAYEVDKDGNMVGFDPKEGEMLLFEDKEPEKG